MINFQNPTISLCHIQLRVSVTICQTGIEFDLTGLTRYKWSDRATSSLQSQTWWQDFRYMFLSSMTERKSTYEVAHNFNDYMIQAIHQICPITSVSGKGSHMLPIGTTACVTLRGLVQLLPVLVWRAPPTQENLLLPAGNTVFVCKEKNATPGWITYKIYDIWSSETRLRCGKHSIE